MTETNKKNTNNKFEEFQNMQMKIVQMNSSLIGSNQLNESYGKKGKDFSENFMNSQNIIDSKKNIFNARKDEAEKLGISYQPNPVTDYDLILNAKKSTNEAMSTLTLGNLEKAVKSIAPGLKFNVADKVAGKTVSDVYNILEKTNGDQSKITEEMADIMNYHQILSDAYETSSALNIMQTISMDSYNDIGKEISEKYNKKQEIEKENKQK